MMFFGTVTRNSTGNVWVKIPEIGGSKELGPFPSVYTHSSVTNDDGYLKGDRVLLARIGNIKGQMVVIGKVSG